MCYSDKERKVQIFVWYCIEHFCLLHIYILEVKSGVMSSDIDLNIWCARIRLIFSKSSTSIFQPLFGISSQTLAATPRILRILINFYLFYKPISLSHEPKLSFRLILCFLSKLDILFNFIRLFLLYKASEASLVLNSFVAQWYINCMLYPIWFHYREQYVGEL